MITMEMLAGWFGGEIPGWFWTIGGAIVAIVAIIWICQPKKKSGGKGQSSSGPNIKVARNMDGTFYAYDADSGSVMFTAATKSEVDDWKKQNYPTSNASGKK